MTSKDLSEFFLSWSQTFVNSSKSWRRKVVDQVIEGLRAYGTKQDPQSGEKIYQEMIKKHCELIGVAPNIMYMRVEEYSGGEPTLKSLYAHPFGMPTLLYHGKGTPMLLLVNPGIRFNGNVIQEVRENKYFEKAEGISS